MKIAIAGAGGLGSNIADILLRSGVKEFFIYDFDKVEKSNLNRQFYFEDQIGKYKADCIKENLEKIDSTCRIKSMVIKVEKNNLKELFDHCDVIIEAFDKAEYKSMLVEEYLNSDKLIVSACGIADFDLEHVEVKKFAKNCFVVGDFKKDIKDYATYSTKVIFISSIMANIVLKEGGYYDKK